MMWFRAPKGFLIAVGVSFIIQSCAGTNSRQSSHGSAPAAARPTASIDQHAAVAAARQHMNAGEYQNAIDNYRAAYKIRPGDQELALEYAASLEDINAAADEASHRADFASAGRIYDILLKNYSSFSGFARVLSFDEAHLNESLSHCRKSLSARGFQEYRKGNLSEAIALWQSLLTIDPDNVDIKGAVATATLQQKNLQERTVGK